MKRILCPAVLSAIALALLLVAPAHAQGQGIYVVQSGDTLTHIAARHGLTATQLAAANGLNWNAWVYAGQRLTIPAPAAAGVAGGTTPGEGGMTPAPTGGTYVVQRGDSLTTIARRYGVTVDRLAAANNLGRTAWVYAGQRLRIPGQGGMTPAPTAAGGAYIVRPGDTLLRIAMRHGLTVQRLAMANGMHVNAWVYIGQRLTIPAPAAAGIAGGTTPAPTGGTTPAPAGGGTYVVRPGDTLIGIAVRHGVGVSQLAASNGLNATAWVYVGQRLQIPRPGSAQAAPQPAPPSANPPSLEGKWIDVNLTAQTLTAYVGNRVVLHTKVSTGTQRTPTVVGTYHIYRKYASTHMSGPGYSLPNVPHTMFFYRGYGIHGTYWHNNFGTPMSHGCVNLPLAEAEWLFEWAPVGTKVVTHY